MGKMPKQKPGLSKQDYGTPPELVAAIERRFGMLTWDVAADADNAVVSDGRFFSLAGINALDADWSAHFTPRDLLFLNPPFGAIGHVWAPLVAQWRRRLPWLRLLMLTPASVGSEWFQRYVHKRALTLPLSPRLHYVGADDPYPKDCMLSCFGFGVGFDVWRWDEDIAPLPAPTPGPKRARPPVKRLAPAPAGVEIVPN
jgi:hypothetical protein